MWAFCFRSLFREYGWQFLWRVALRRPVRTMKAMLDSGRIDVSGDRVATSDEDAGPRPQGARSIVGVGFCLKPMDPPCPSGRANHDCRYLERLMPGVVSDAPACCRQCAIAEIGVMALKADAAFYIMTSAKDILLDLFVPALHETRFSSGLFVLCRYSFRPFAAGLLASGIRARLFPFERGDCRDYRTWLRADRGIKDEQTAIHERNRRTIADVLAHAQRPPAPRIRFVRQGNVLYPQQAPDNASP